MCYSFEFHTKENFFIEKHRHFNIDFQSEKPLKDLQIKPTDLIRTFKWNNDKPQQQLMRWGIKFSESSPFIYNSRIETIKNKPFWNNLFNKNRCILPMTGFHEWKPDGKKKIQYKVYLPDFPVFFVPGLYVEDKNTKQLCASLITTEPNSFMLDVHHRMPVLLRPDDAEMFLTNTLKQNFELCIPYNDNYKMDIEIAV